MKKTVFTIDGRQLCGQMGGVQRYISEIVNELDKITPKGIFEIVVPKSCKNNFDFQNIEVVKFGKRNGLIWEQIDLPYYILKNKRVGIYLCTIIPLLYPKGIVVVHDVMGAINHEFLGNMKFFTRLIFLLNLKIAVKKSDYPATVSENSRKDMARLYKRKLDDIYIIPDAWQHINRVIPDDGWMDRFPDIKKGNYYFSLSANRKQKNFHWIEMVARNNPESIFLIAGTVEEWQNNDTIKANNIIQLGYITDGEIKSLMTNCKAFLFPSLYEGFGIPPMEALACGAKVVLSNTSCLPEIYRDAGYYVSPYDYSVDLDKLLMGTVAPPSTCLERFGWDKSAKILFELCNKIIATRKDNKNEST